MTKEQKLFEINTEIEDINKQLKILEQTIHQLSRC